MLPGTGTVRSFFPAIVESVLLPAAAIGLCLWLRPGDPFFLAAKFPWPWLAPLLVALRYGSAGALLASLTLASAWSLALDGGSAPPIEYPKEYFLGGFIAALVCGEFRDLWQAEVQRERKAREYLDRRFEELANADQVLAQSHERLMTDFIGHPPTLRDALADVPRPRAGRLDAGSAQALLVFLARHFQIETAAVHVLEATGLRAAPLAALGPARRLDGSERLVAACLRNGALCHALEEGSEPGPYLFAAPLSPVSGPATAVLAVEKMPFFAFQEENLRGLFAVLCRFADLLAAAAIAARVIDRVPDCPEDFAAGYLSLHRLHAAAGVPGVLAARVLAARVLAAPAAGAGGAQGADRRPADLFWRRDLGGGRTALIALLPFCSEEQGRVALARLGGEAGAGGPGNPFDSVRSLSGAEPVAELEDFLAEVDELARGRTRAPAAGEARTP